jgi:hypothetical protein
MITPAHVTADAYNRITVPKDLSDRISWIRGTTAIQAWILLLVPGRYRLLSDEQVESDPILEPVRSLILDENLISATEPTRAEDLRRAAIVARLVQATLAPPGPGWRISFPKAFNVFVPPECDLKAFSILFSLEGYLEIWYTDVLRKAVVLPLGGQQ